MATHVRTARPVSDLARSADRYCRGLGYVVLGSFEDDEGFDGVMVGAPGGALHFAFTRCRAHPVQPTPTAEDLVVLYVPETADRESTCRRMAAAGYRAVASFNP